MGSLYALFVRLSVGTLGCRADTLVVSHLSAFYVTLRHLNIFIRSMAPLGKACVMLWRECLCYFDHCPHRVATSITIKRAQYGCRILPVCFTTKTIARRLVADRELRLKARLVIESKLIDS